jgi:hypothetical protein
MRLGLVRFLARRGAQEPVETFARDEATRAEQMRTSAIYNTMDKAPGPSAPRSDSAFIAPPLRLAAGRAAR